MIYSILFNGYLYLQLFYVILLLHKNEYSRLLSGDEAKKSNFTQNWIKNSLEGSLYRSIEFCFFLSENDHNSNNTIRKSQFPILSINQLNINNKVRFRPYSVNTGVNFKSASIMYNYYCINDNQFWFYQHYY